MLSYRRLGTHQGYENSPICHRCYAIRALYARNPPLSGPTADHGPQHRDDLHRYVNVRIRSMQRVGLPRPPSGTATNGLAAYKQHGRLYAESCGVLQRFVDGGNVINLTGPLAVIVKTATNGLET